MIQPTDPAPPDPKAEPAPAIANPVYLTAIAFALGLAVELLFHGRPLGVSFPLWAALAGGGLLLAAWREDVRPAPTSWILPPLILFLSSMVVFRLEALTVFLNIVVTLVLFTIWVRTLRPGRLLDFGWLDFLVAEAWVPLEAWIRPWGVLGEVQRRAIAGRERQSQAFAIGRGVLLAFPILVLFIVLLSAADLIFADYVETALEWLDLERIFDYLGRTAVVIVSGVFFLGAIVAALRRPARVQLLGEDRPLVPSFLGYTETVIVLGGVDLLFALFVAIQFRYFFGGEANITAAGYTYAEYARRGFGELVVLSFLTLGLILALAGWGRRETTRQQARFNLLSGLLVGLMGVMLVSAFQRLLLYENAFGFTRLRAYTHVAIVWMAVLFVGFLILLLLNRLRRFAPLAALAAVGFAVSLNLLNVDAFIVRHNLARSAAGEELDAWYLAGLSNDAVPLLVAALDDVPEDSVEILLPQMACRRAMLEARQEETGWPSYQVAHLAALSSLETIAPRLDPYPVTSQGRWFWEVEVDGEPTYCAGLP